MLAGLKSKYEADLQYAQSARSAGPAQVPPSQPRLRFLLEGYMPHMLVPLTVAFAAMRFRRPRPGRRRLMNQPGSVVFTSSLFVVAFAVGAVLVRIAAAPMATSPWMAVAATYGLCHWATGPVVLGGWLVLLLGGRWHPEKSWIDRAGRVLGYLWVIQPLGGFV